MQTWGSYRGFLQMMTTSVVMLTLGDLYHHTPLSPDSINEFFSLIFSSNNISWNENKWVKIEHYLYWNNVTYYRFHHDRCLTSP